jgi:hypothetical protein
MSWLSRRCGTLNISQPCRLPQPVRGIPLLLYQHSFRYLLPGYCSNVYVSVRENSFINIFTQLSLFLKGRIVRSPLSMCGLLPLLGIGLANIFPWYRIHAAIGELLVACYPVWLVAYQRKVCVCVCIQPSLLDSVFINMFLWNQKRTAVEELLDVACVIGK